MNPRDMIADLETVPDAVIDGPAPIDTGEPAAADPPEVPAADPTEAAVEQPFDPSEFRTELDSLRFRNQQLEEVLAHALQPGDTTPDMGGQAGVDWSMLDPLDDNYGQQLGQLFDQNNQQLLGEIRQLLHQTVVAPMQQQQMQESEQVGESRLQDILADDIAKNGEFHPVPEVDRDIRAEVRTRADEVFGDLANRYGGIQSVLAAGLGPRLSELAMTTAAQQTRDKYRRIMSTAVEVEDNRRATLAGLPSEPGITAGAVAGTPRFNDVKSVGDFYASRARSVSSAA